MKEWKEALWLVKFEFKHSLKNFILLFAVTILILFLVHSMIPIYLEQPTMPIDFYFVLFIFSGYVPLITRPKQFKMQQRSGLFYAAPFLVALNGLAVTKEVIVKYKFLAYLIIVSLTNCIFLIGMYPVFSVVMSLQAYLVFAIIWFSFSIYIGCMNPTFEAATNLVWVIFYSFIIGLLLFFLYVFLFYRLYPNGLVSWTIDIATAQPVLSIIISVILAIFGWKFWMNIMRKKITRADYF